jgi:predicted MFS family arabinose efflux permease
VFSMRYLASNIGVSVGPLLGAWLGIGHGSLPFAITGAFYFIYAITLYSLVIGFGIRQIEGGAKKETVTIASAWQVIRSDVILRFFIPGAIVVGIGYCQMTVTLSQFLDDNFQHGVRMFAALMSVNAITVVTMQMPLSRWSEKRPPITAIHVGNVFFALGLLGFALSSNWAGFIASMVVFTLGEILNYPAGSLLMDRLAPEGMRGTYFGAQSFGNLGQFIGPWAGGLLLGAYGGTAAFVAMGFVMLSASLFYRAGDRRMKMRKRTAA